MMNIAFYYARQQQQSAYVWVCILEHMFDASNYFSTQTEIKRKKSRNREENRRFSIDKLLFGDVVRIE